MKTSLEFTQLRQHPICCAPSGNINISRTPTFSEQNLINIVVPGPIIGWADNPGSKYINISLQKSPNLNARLVQVLEMK